MKKVFYSLFALAMTAMTFTSCEDVPMPYDQPGGGGNDPVVIEPTGDGTFENPFNVAAARKKCEEIGTTESSEKYYIKGKVNETTTSDDSYGNATFDIVDQEGGDKFKCFQVAGSDGKRLPNGFVFEKDDEVVVYGSIYNYRGDTPETTGKGTAYVVTVNGKKTDGGDTPTETIGTADNPITTAKAIELINALENGGKIAEKAFVKGKIVKVTTSEDNFAKYGNINYYISDDGSSTNQLQVYAGDGLNGEKFSSVSDIKTGDEVVVFGTLYKYVNNSNGNVTPEITDSYLVKLTPGSDTPQPNEEVKKVSIADFNAAAESTNVWYQLTGTVKNLKDGDLYGNFDLEDATGSVYVYGLLSEKGGEKKKFQDLVAAKGIQNGCTITIIGNRGSFNGKIEVVNAYFVSIGDNPDTPDTPAGNVTKAVEGNVVTLTVPDTQEDNTVTVDLNAQGWESGKAVNPATITLSDGTTVTFAKGDGSNTPAYYEGTKGVRVYAKNTITISGKAVAKVVMKCDTYNNTNYTGNSQLYATADGTTFTICNDYTEAKGGDQLRVQTITITYAK